MTVISLGRIALRAGDCATEGCCEADARGEKQPLCGRHVHFIVLYGSSGAGELRRPLGMERLHALAEVVRLPQPAVAMALELDRHATA